MKRRFLTPAALAVAGSLVLTACGDDDSGGSDGVDTLRVANLPVVATMLLNVAEEQGYFEDEGIEVEVTESFELATFIPALGRQYDIVMTTPTDFLSAATKGFDIVATGADWADGAGVISAKAETIQDLDGMKIATNSLTGLQYAMLQDSLEQNDVEAELIQVPFASQPDQLKAGEVDAATVPEPWASDLLQDDAYTRVFTPVEEATGVPDTLTGWYSVSRAFADDNPEAMDAFNEALRDAVAWIQENEDEFRTQIQEWLELSPETAEVIEMPKWTDEVSEEDLQVYVEPLIRQEQLEESAADLDFSEFVLD